MKRIKEELNDPLFYDRMFGVTVALMCIIVITWGMLGGSLENTRQNRTILGVAPVVAAAISRAIYMKKSQEELMSITVLVIQCSALSLVGVYMFEVALTNWR